MDARKVYAVCRRGFVGGWSEGESDGEKWWGVNLVQSEKQSGFTGVGDWVEALHFRLGGEVVWRNIISIIVA